MPASTKSAAPIPVAAISRKIINSTSGLARSHVGSELSRVKPAGGGGIVASVMRSKMVSS